MGESSAFPWDGSCLGESRLVRAWTAEETPYATFQLSDGRTLHCTAQRTPAARAEFSCAADELKPLFSLPKRDSHHLRAGKDAYVVYRVPADATGALIWEPPLCALPREHSLRADERFCGEVRRLLACRDVLGTHGQDERAVCVRSGPSGCYPVSAEWSPCARGFSQRVLAKWFGESDPRSYVQEIFAKQGDFLEIATAFRRDAERIIGRVAPAYLWYSNVLARRFTDSLLSPGGPWAETA